MKANQCAGTHEEQNRHDANGSKKTQQLSSTQPLWKREKTTSLEHARTEILVLPLNKEETPNLQQNAKNPMGPEIILSSRPIGVNELAFLCAGLRSSWPVRFLCAKSQSSSGPIPFDLLHSFYLVVFRYSRFRLTSSIKLSSIHIDLTDSDLVCNLIDIQVEIDHFKESLPAAKNKKATGPPTPTGF